jgi:hypothetical protein
VLVRVARVRARIVRLCCVLAVILLAGLPVHAEARAAARNAPLGEIRRIVHHLGVTPPTLKESSGRVQELMYTQYGLQTRRLELGSLGFKDGTLLYINQNTSLILSSPSLTQVKTGEVGQTLVPGTNHTVQTPSAVASAIGTDFDVQATPKKTTFYVREGSLLVSNDKGSVYVTTGEGVVVRKEQAPGTPFRYTLDQYHRAFLWRKPLADPLAPLDTNIALAANCGRVVGVSSEQTPGDSTQAIDGRLDTGWVSADGQTTNQSLTLGFCGSGPYLISRVVLSIQPFGSIGAASGVKEFAIAVARTGAADGAPGDNHFHTVFTGAMLQRAGLQAFSFTQPASARYVRLVAIDNFGDQAHLALSEFEVAGHPDNPAMPPVTPCYIAAPCVAQAVSIVNTARQRAGLPPLALDPGISTGNGSCAGAYGHSVAMAATGMIWHTAPGDNPKHPTNATSFPNDVCRHGSYYAENVGEAASGNEQADVQTILGNALHELHTRQHCANPAAIKTGIYHACNIYSARYRRLGIGLYFANTATWLTMDFSS